MSRLRIGLFLVNSSGHHTPPALVSHSTYDSIAGQNSFCISLYRTNKHHNQKPMARRFTIGLISEVVNLHNFARCLRCFPENLPLSYRWRWEAFANSANMQ
jgi:hypothetical protein